MDPETKQLLKHGPVHPSRVEDLQAKRNLEEARQRLERDRRFSGETRKDAKDAIRVILLWLGFICSLVLLKAIGCGR